MTISGSSTSTGSFGATIRFDDNNWYGVTTPFPLWVLKQLKLVEVLNQASRQELFNVLDNFNRTMIVVQTKYYLM